MKPKKHVPHAVLPEKLRQRTAASVYVCTALGLGLLGIAAILGSLGVTGHLITLLWICGIILILGQITR